MASTAIFVRPVTSTRTAMSVPIGRDDRHRSAVAALFADRDDLRVDR